MSYSWHYRQQKGGRGEIERGKREMGEWAVGDGAGGERKSEDKRERMMDLGNRDREKERRLEVEDNYL